jgi:hypothetical protein
MSVADILAGSTSGRGGRKLKLVTFREAERIDRSTRQARPLPSAEHLLVPSAQSSMSLGQLIT